MCFVFSSPVQADERALFVSVIQEPAVLESREAIEMLVKYAKKAQIETLFVQVYRSNQAWFPSKVADSSPYERCRAAVGEDAFAFLIREAQASGIKVHAWLNLLSLGANSEAPLLKKHGMDIVVRREKIDEQYFLEPKNRRVQQALRQVVREVVRTYPDLDGIQFDYIRYPDWNPPGQKTIVQESKAYQDKRRSEVTRFLKQLRRRAHSDNPRLAVSVTGLMPYSRAYYEASQDWRKWVNSGLADFVTLMCYVKDRAIFERYLKDAETQFTDLKKVTIAVGAYSQLKSPEIFAEQWKLCEEKAPRACAVLHYGNLVEEEALAAPLASFKDMTGQ